MFKANFGRVLQNSKSQKILKHRIIHLNQQEPKIKGKKKFAFRSYGSKVISRNTSANLACWWRYRFSDRDSKFAVVDNETVFYLYAKFHNFPASSSGLP